MVRLASPILFGAALLPTVVLSIWASSFVTNTVFLSPDFYDGTLWPLIVTLPGAFIGIVVFAGVARITASLERLSRPKALDHPRRCAILYLVLVFIAGWMAVSYSPTGSNFAFAFQIQVLTVVCAGIFADALVLFTKSRPNENSTKDAGGET